MSALPDNNYAGNEHHSVSVRVLSSAQELDRRMCDAAHKRWGAAVMELEDAERLLARIFSTLEKCGEDMLKAGSRVDVDWDVLPLSTAAHNVWGANKVGPAPVRGV